MTGGGIDAAEMLRRLAGTLKTEVAPQVTEEYARTQAFMASVIVERLAKQVELANEHAAMELSDLTRLCAELEGILASSPPAVTQALAALSANPSTSGLGPLIDELYAWGLDEAAAGEALAAIRPVLRRDIDRRMEVAR